jgi:drug/metabolite transporter, DME family
VWDVDATDVGMLALMGLVQFALPYVFFTAGLRWVSGAEASLIALVEPVLNPVWVAILIGEEPSTATIVGGVIIIGGLALRYGFMRTPEDATLTADGDELGEPAERLGAL